MTRGLSYFSCIFLPCPLLRLHFNHLLNVVSPIVLNWAEGFSTLMRYINPLTYLLPFFLTYSLTYLLELIFVFGSFTVTSPYLIVIISAHC